MLLLLAEIYYGESNQNPGTQREVWESDEHLEHWSCTKLVEIYYSQNILVSTINLN